MYIYVETEGGKKEFIPAAPPVSLNGITDSIANVDAELMRVIYVAMDKRTSMMSPSISGTRKRSTAGDRAGH